jgi:hypothetical protein
MKTYKRFLDVPASASYLGSSDGDGCISEELADYVEAANEAAVYVDADGLSHYFDLQ